MLYAIFAKDVPRSHELRADTRSRHLDYVRRLQQEGRLVLAGPLPAIDSPDPGPAGMTGSLIVAEFESLEAAHAWSAADPYSKAGVFDTVTIMPFVEARL